MNLTELFDQYGSDKGNLGHCHQYSFHYEKLIPRTTNAILEIGIGSHINFNGSFGSIRAWLDWLESGTVYGFDIVEPPKELLERENFVFVQGDQGNPDDLARLAEVIGEVDAIIDDGSHLSEHQLLSLEALWPCVREGGIYVIEDIHFRWGSHPAAFDVVAEDSRLEGWIGPGYEKRAAVLRKSCDLEQSSPLAAESTTEDSPKFLGRE